MNAFRFACYPLFLLFATSLLGGTIAEEKLVKPKELPREWQELVENLSSSDFATRIKAEQSLIELGVVSDQSDLGGLYDLLIKSDDPDLRIRLRSTVMGIFREQFFGRSMGFVGIRMTNAGQMVKVAGVQPETAAEKADLRMNDLIMEVDGKNFQREMDPSEGFKRYIQGKRPGETVELAVRRGMEILTIKISLGERPAEYRFMAQDQHDILRNYQIWEAEQRRRLGLEFPGDGVQGVEVENNGIEVDPFLPRR